MRMVFVSVLMLVIAVSGIYAVRGLYSDGAFFALQLLNEKGGSWVFDLPRVLVPLLCLFTVARYLDLR